MDTRDEIYDKYYDKLSKHSMDTLSVCSGDTLITQNTMDTNHSSDNSHHSCSSYLSNMSMSGSSTNSSTHSSTPKSNSPAMYISINGDVIDQHLTVLQLPNSETIDTKDVYVMANSKKKIKSSLIVPKWTSSTNTEEIETESADEYDSEAHTQTDEDIIIKRVLAKCVSLSLFIYIYI